MGAVTRARTCVLFLCAIGCASAPPSPPAEDEPEMWGDEYAGITDDADLEDALVHAQSTHSSASIDALVDPESVDGANTLRSLAATARTAHAAARYRESSYGRAGAAEVYDLGWLQHVVVGAVRPVIGEGALVADARELGTPSTRTSPTASALRISPSSSLWGSVTGAGVAVAVGRARFSLAAWQPHDDDTTLTAWSGLEWRVGRTRVGAAVGQTSRPSQTNRAVSLLAAHSFRSAFASLETAVAGGGLACAARVVAGDAWRAGFAAGAAAPSEMPVGSARRDRRMAILERRDHWRGVSSRVVMSSVARREGPEEERRRRIDASLRARVDDGARVEAGVRFLESDAVEAPSPLAAGEHATRDEWRARVVLFVRERPSPSMEVEHTFRIDAVRAEASPGIAGTWRGSLRYGAFDGRVQASAWGLKPGQLGYLGREGLPGSGAFTTISGAGSELSLVVRGRFRAHASIAAEWRRKASGDESVLVAASLAW
jgi:hypothetical protein